MKEKVGFVLLPGGGMSDWVWIKILDKLEIPFVSIKQRLKINTYETRVSSSVNDCIDNILDTLSRVEFNQYIIVAHSGAGILAGRLCRIIPEKIKHAIYVAANIPKQGKTAVDSLPLLIKFLNIAAIKKMVKINSVPLVKISNVMRDKFCNTCDEETIAHVLKQEMLSEPLCVLKEKMDWTNYPEINRTYIVLLQDHTLSVKGQKQMAANLKINDLRAIESDHMVMLSHPDQFVKILNEIAGKYI